MCSEGTYVKMNEGLSGGSGSEGYSDVGVAGRMSASGVASGGGGVVSSPLSPSPFVGSGGGGAGGS